jgi:hypothetical protein
MSFSSHAWQLEQERVLQAAQIRGVEAEEQPAERAPELL